ncbi:MAG TPA: hypothetical protein VFA26_24440 [Gemmataceae bacterium]|nr:hypothetical protein [Gemmataceae bacterium]
MATVTTPSRRPTTLTEAHRRIRHPLQRLRGYIRGYVAAEGLCLLLSMLAVWFWVGLLLDYAPFGLADADWVDAVPRFLRAAFLGTLFTGVVGAVTAGIFTRAVWIVGGVAGALGALLGFVAGWFGSDLGFGLLLGAFTGTTLAAFAIMAVSLFVLLLRGGLYVLVGIPVFFAYVILWAVVGGLAGGGGWAAAVVVLALIVLPVAAVAAKRLFYDFSDQQLALVLERRYPQVLGDRLITAVELSDPREAARLGYSPAMVEETIHEAAARVATLPVKEVFDWRRLFLQALVVGVVTVGIGGLALGGAAVYARTSKGGASGAGDLGHGAAYWADRDLQLKNKNWPRRAHVLLLAPEDQIKVGQNQIPPVVKARAFRWVVADEGAYMSWRPLTWDDLAKDKDLLGGPRPEVEMPADWSPRFADSLTIDEIELNLDKPETHKSLSPDAQKALRGMLAQMEERFAAGEVSRRTARLLSVPESVTVLYTGPNTKSEMSLQRGVDNEYVGKFPELKESVAFRVRGENFYTPWQHIQVVPPPSLIRMTRDEARPAYRYVRGPAEDLRDKKLLFRELGVGLFGGEKSEINVPAGSDVTVRAVSDKDLRADGARIMPPRKGVPEVKAPVTVLDDEDGRPRVFVAEFKNVRTALDFFFEFTDTDNVTSTRHVVIKPAEDTPPEFDDLAVEYLRKTAQGYLVTPRAEIPFTGKVKDDVALASVEFAYTLSRADAPKESGLNALFLLLGGAARGALTREPREGPEAGKGIQRVAVPGFDARLQRLRDEFMPYARLRLLLETPPEQRDAADRNLDVSSRELYKLHKFEVDEPDTWFDLDPMIAAQRHPGRARLPVSLLAREGEPQHRWRMQLWVEATDNNILAGDASRDPISGRQRGRSKDTFTFLIVSEEELLAEVAREEENLHVKLDDVLRRLDEGEKRISGDRLALGSPQFKDDQYGAIADRIQGVRDAVEKAQADTATVYADYQRILRELKANRIQTRGMIEKVEKHIVENLRIAVEKEFGEAGTAIQEFRDALEARQANAAAKKAAADKAGAKAQAELNKLRKRLEEVAQHMESLTNINQLIKMLAAIQEEQIRQSLILEGVKKSLVDKILEGLEGESPKDKPKK